MEREGGVSEVSASSKGVSPPVGSCKIKPFLHFERLVVEGSGVVFTST